MSPLLAAPLFVVSLAVTLAAAASFARRLDHLGTRFGLPESLVGVLTALAADGPEITSAMVALLKGAHNVSIGVLVGSNVFNLAAMLGLSALLAGAVRVGRHVLALEGAVGGAVTLVTAAALLGWISPGVAALLDACVVVPYIVNLLRDREIDGRPAAAAGPLAPPPAAAPVRDDPTHHLLALVLVDVVLVIAGSTGMVQTVLTLGDHWHIARALIGVLVLGPLTSIPNAFTGVRLGLAGRGSALVSETFNSNTINLAVGLVLPALFVALGTASSATRIDLAWLIAMTVLCAVMLAGPRGMGRLGGALLVAMYAGFWVVTLAAS